MADKKEIGTRINMFRKMIDKTLIQLSKEANVSHSNIARIERGEIFPNFLILEYLHNRYKLNFHWLITGNGEMFNNNFNNNDKISLIKKLFPNIKLDETFFEIYEVLANPKLSKAMRHKFAIALEVAKVELPHLFQSDKEGENHLNKSVKVGGA